MRKKIFNYVISLILVFALLFSVSAFTSCKKEPEKEPDHNTETDPKPTPTPDPKPVVVSKEYKLFNWYVKDKMLPRIKLTNNNFATTTFPVPQREHFIFNGWYMGEDKVADETGKSLMTEALFNREDTDITAKWTALESFSYKILLVYVTQIDAVLPVRDLDSSDKVHIKYTMNDLEREFCQTTTVNLKKTMDEMMDGLVDFQIDEYFTTEIVDTECFEIAEKFGSRYSRLFPEYIPEISDLKNNYDACIVVDNVGTQVRSSNIAGEANSALIGQAEVSLDSFFNGAILNGKTLEEQLNAMIADPEYDDLTRNTSWKIWLQTFIHEHAHIVEIRISDQLNLDNDYHSVVGDAEYFHECQDEIITNKFYYLHLIEKDGVIAGIPYGFWKGDIAKVRYEVIYDNLGSTGGHVSIKGMRFGISDWSGSANCTYEVVYGDSITATVKPYEGYKFIRWSDGVETATRTDLITGDLTVTALFEPKEYKVKVVAGAGGQIGGYGKPAGEYTLIMRGNSLYIQAIPDEGYRFVKWSDGNTEWSRDYYIDITNVDMFDENETYILTAIFEKI